MYSVHKSAKFQPQGAADIPQYKFVEILQQIVSEKLEHGINYALIIFCYSSVSSLIVFTKSQITNVHGKSKIWPYIVCHISIYKYILKLLLVWFW